MTNSWFCKVLRKMFFMPEPRITREQALEIARAECERRSWLWKDPATTEGLRYWYIDTVRDIKGSPWLLVSQQTGEVIRSGCPLR